MKNVNNGVLIIAIIYCAFVVYSHLFKKMDSVKSKHLDNLYINLFYYFI